MNQIGLILTAAGKSERFGRPKLLAPFRGRPLIEWTIRSFLEFPFSKKILTVNPEQRVHFAAIVQAVDPTIQLIDGHSTRAASVYAGFCALGEDVDAVFIHDGARPFVTLATLNQLHTTLGISEVVIPILPVTDTIKRITPQGIIESTLDRSSLVHVTTPQAFRHNTLKRAYTHALSQGDLHAGLTDEALLCEHIGVFAHTIQGDPISKKVTFPSDLEQL